MGVAGRRGDMSRKRIEGSGNCAPQSSQRTMEATGRPGCSPPIIVSSRTAE